MSERNGAPRWIDLDGAVNARVVVPGALLRSDNLQDLSESDLRRLVDRESLELVLDLRTEYELVREGPGPMTRVPEVRIEHHSLHLELQEPNSDLVKPWGDDAPVNSSDETRVVSHYLNYLHHRPDSVVASIRAIANAPRSVLVHCAAGKDRTGMIVALALDAAGVQRDMIIRDFMATGDRIELIHARLVASPTYRGELERYDPKDHAPVEGAMDRVLEVIDERFGGIGSWLTAHGLQAGELERLRARLGDAGGGDA